MKITKPRDRFGRFWNPQITGLHGTGQGLHRDKFCTRSRLETTTREAIGIANIYTIWTERTEVSRIPRNTAVCSQREKSGGNHCGKFTSGTELLIVTKFGGRRVPCDCTDSYAQDEHGSWSWLPHSRWALERELATSDGNRRAVVFLNPMRETNEGMYRVGNSTAPTPCVK